MYRGKINGLFVFFLTTTMFVSAQTGDLRLLDWEPKARLVVKETKIIKPKYPVIDIHNHLRDLSRAAYYLEEMDKAGVWICVGLDGLSEKDAYKEHLKVSHGLSKERFHIYFAPDFSRIDEPDFGRKEAEKLEEAVKIGIRGLQIYKALGLTLRDKSGKLISIDDPRIDPVWAKCGELGIPVMIHSSDPKAFHDGAVDRYNERYEELTQNPAWAYFGTDVPLKEELLEQRNRVIARHPNTIFIGAHMANLSEDLGRVSLWLEKYPNLYVDIDARIAELGRQPYTARKFMIQHQDRILFGTDTYPNAEAYRMHYRFLETDDEYFDPAPAHKFQGRWMIHGLHLPDEVLEKIYNKNALGIMNMFKDI
ncbi:MAG: amidohydrolase [Tannerellaceae bacterium]|jgi:predicted TIM-barrel fold metal-dependent hydrolase|nr:amidohydrolase [Tannerellaceae bacterium]